MAIYSYLSVKQSVNRVDAWWSRLVLRHPGSWVLYLVANYTNWTPNFLSVLSFVFSLITGIAFLGGYWWLGAISFQISLLFDFIDGRLARLKKQGTFFGEFLDNFFDQAKAGFLVIVLYLSFYIHYPHVVDRLFVVNLISYLFLQEFSVIIWLFAEKNLEKKNEAGTVFKKSTQGSFVGNLMNTIIERFDKIGLRVLLSNIETNVLVFSILPLIINYSNFILILSNFLLMVFIIPELFVVYKIIKTRDQSKIS